MKHLWYHSKKIRPFGGGISTGELWAISCQTGVWEMCAKSNSELVYNYKLFNYFFKLSLNLFYQVLKGLEFITPFGFKVSTYNICSSQQKINK